MKTGIDILSNSVDATPCDAREEVSSHGVRHVPALASFTAVLSTSLAMLMMLTLRGRMADPDLWWHLRNAEYLLTHHRFPVNDIYSFTARGAPWVPHEWLGEMILYAGYRLGGLVGVFAVSLVLCELIILGVFYLCYRVSGDIKNSFLMTMLGVLLGTVSFGPRTLLLGWLLLVILLILLLPIRLGKPAKLWAIPLLFLVWVNSHGSWFMGLIIVGIVIICGLGNASWGQVDAVPYSRPHLRKLLATAAASLVAVFINPSGYKVVLYPLDVRLNQKVSLAYIQEWASIDFHDARGILVMGVLMAILAVVLFSRKRWRLEEVALTALAIYMSLTYVRMVFLAAILVPPILAVRCKLFAPYDAEAERPTLNAAVVGALIVLMVAVVPRQSQLDSQVDKMFPKGAVAYLKSRAVHGNLFNEYLWGGYLIWNTPDLPVFIDGRGDIYDHVGAFSDYVAAFGVTESFAVLDKYKIDYVLLRPNSPMAYLLKNSPSWATEYSDNGSTLFHRVAHRAAAAAP